MPPADMATTTDRMGRLRARGPGVWPALLLVLCLLLAQHAGLTHRVRHGGLANQPLVSAAHTQGHDGQQEVSLKSGGHSCVLFDGATVADGHFGTPSLPLLKYGKPVTPASLARSWPDLPARQPFHSRAPPAPLANA